MSRQQESALTAARSKLSKIRSEQERANARLEAVQALIKSSGQAVDELGVAQVLNPSAGADTALGKARADRDAAIEELDGLEEAIGFLATAETRVELEVAELERVAAADGFKAAKAALRDRVVKAAPSIRDLVDAVLTLRALERRPAEAPSDRPLTARDLRYQAAEVEAAPVAVVAAIAAHVPWADLLAVASARAAEIRAKGEVESWLGHWNSLMRSPPSAPRSTRLERWF